MVLFSRFHLTSPRSTTAASSFGGAALPITVRVVEDTHSYTADDGSAWWSGGYAPVYEDADGENYFLALGEYLSDTCVLYCKVAGVRHYPEALRDPRFKPGSAAILRLEPDNPYDSDAVGVWDGTGSVQVGHIPADLSTDVASRIRAGEPLVAFVLREIRRQSKRSALHLLVMPAGELNLSIAEKNP
jgi:hypothetical protein